MRAKESHLNANNIVVRFLGPDVAVVHVDWKAEFWDQDGKGTRMATS
jgi:hypothetical protein